MKKKLSLVAVLLLAMTLVACGGGNKKNAEKDANATNKETTEEAKATDVNVGFVTDEGGVNDQSFNQGVWEGLQKAQKEIGIKAEYIESKDTKDYTPNLETFVDQEKNLIVGAGFKMGDAISEAAAMYPEINYAIVDVDVTAGPDGKKVEAPKNLLGIMFRAQEPSFLVGYIAGMTSETNKVGFVGGQEGNIIWGFEYGYRAGVDYAAKEKGTNIEILSQYVGNFTDAQKGKSITATMFQNGADVVFHAAGGAGEGVIEAAKEAGKWAIGVDRDQSDRAPENVLTSAMKNGDVAVYQVVKDMQEGKFEGGKTIELGLANDGAVGIAPTSDKNVKPEILKKVDEITQKIISGEIKVPYNEETYNQYK
ncbi:BMP family ABC transporter substrate-binding protein [Peptoniphilus sp. AGMB00490]|uniref:BMP family ABC transporter substrate-binding protein n=2 Tax=Peptoniphilus TaxID=162289 RepID=A0ACD6AYY0_9FIRM|nr:MULTISPECIES: BMP family ABC transporter substrate-binding protein [Peptoniphilus]NMW86018.1 BMP family ABC transporter substrate-binding protein [Peptoniphilus faecalis]OLR64440.1 BMP family ABC transporter substrate-binding protein [Peptoniphilus porci]